ncbi:QWRF motif-containing protein 2 [Cinnamomum micranthum f. kanehirae]|uniref:QWRF motif-containing protein 2 n=1 Tax=Cinnamomum micranthum f. kanehirae TaxID=337451 RepID=A0A3S3Q2D0_9MAGN|nr:QWRF motif-containing protein 2 [Cinnamomum micranthum f. kanehirae]
MRSLDFSSENLKSGGLAVRSLQQSILVEEDRRRVLFHGRTDSDLDNGSAKMSINGDSDNGSALACNLTTSTTTASDTESVSSGSNSGTQEFIGTDPPGHTASRGIGISARFWQETNSRLRRLQEPCSQLSTRTTTTTTTTTTNHNLIPVKKSTLFDSPSSSPHMMNQALSSPLRRPVRHPSPSKLFTSTTTMSSSSVSSSPLRGTQSPLRMRNVSASSVRNHSSNPPSILSFAADVRRGKMGENRIEDAHVLRLLYNRHLQWRFVNARAEAGLSIQRLTAEKNLYNAWEATSELRDSVTFKKIQLQLFRKNWKLTTILKEQLFYLEEWALLDRDHSSSLSGAIEAMKASTLRLPVIGGARADVQKVKDAVSSAVDVMQALGSSICSLLSRVQGTDSLVSELANVAAQEQELLSQCKDLLSTVALLQAEECSLRTHLLQLKQERHYRQRRESLSRKAGHFLAFSLCG